MTERDTNSSRALQIIFAVAIIGVLATGGGLAITSVAPVTGELPLQTQTGTTVTIKNPSGFPATPFASTSAIQMDNGTVGGPGAQASVDVPGDFDIGGTQTFDIVNANTEVRIDKTDANAIAVQGSINSVTIDPTTTVDDGQRDFRYDAATTTNITVEGLTANEQFLLVDSAGEGLATATADGTGEVTFTDVEPGVKNVRITTFALEIRELAPDVPLVQGPNSNVTVRLFEEGSERVFTRTTNTGVIALTEFPDQTRFTVTADADGFVTRRTFITSARQQQDVYLLNNTTPTGLARFSVEDRTGDFSGDESATLQIERAVNSTDTAPSENEYEAVAGDIVGAQLTFDAELETNVRYRITVSNGDGDTRQLGAFLIKGSRTINLVISGIDQSIDVPSEQPAVNISQTSDAEADGNRSIDFIYTDPGANTSQVDVRIEEAGNSSNVIARASDSDPDGVSQLKFSETLTGPAADQRLVANFTATLEDGSEVSGVRAFGQQQFPLLTQLDPGWAKIFGVGFLLVFGGVFSVANARIGAVAIPGVALLLNLTGILDGVVTVVAVGATFAVAVGANIVSSTSGGFLS
jgi:hypothetical protein